MTDDAPVDLSTYVDDVRAPIPPADDPASTDPPAVGNSATYDDDFQAVKARIDALGTLSGRIDQEKALSDDDDSLYDDAPSTDFEFIASTGQRILAEQSKDLRIACYVALALYHTDGFDGLGVGLDGLQALIDTYWESLYPSPERMRGRGASLNFLMQRLVDALEDVSQPTLGDRPHLETAIDRVSSLGTFFMEEMGEHAPVTSTLKRRLETLLRNAPEPEPDPEPSGHAETAETDAPSEPTDRRDEDASPAGGASDPEDDSGDAGSDEAASTRSASPSRQPGSTNSTRRDGSSPELDRAGTATPSDAEQTIVRAAGVLRDADPTDPRPYHLLRSLRWAPLSAVPPNDDGRTRIQPPNDRRIDYLRGLLDDGSTDTLVAQAEDSFQQPPFHFWLDLQRLIAQAASQSDAGFDAVRRAILVETALLVDRVPALLNLRFADGTPFADEATRAWIESTVRETVGSSGNANAPADVVDEAAGKAQRVLGADGLTAALEALRRVDGRDRSRRTDFRIRLATAQTCLQAGKPRLARPVLDALVDEGHQLDLADWEPRLMVEAWTASYRCYHRLAQAARRDEASDGETNGPVGDAETPTTQADRFAERADHAFERVCALDPSRALSLSGTE